LAGRATIYKRLQNGENAGRTNVFVSTFSFYQHRNGLPPQEAFETFIASWRALMTMPGFRVQWRRNRASFHG